MVFQASALRRPRDTRGRADLRPSTTEPSTPLNKERRKLIAANLLAALVALLHLYFLVLEMFFWTRPLGRKAFGLKADFAEQTKVLAANQGLYNGFIAGCNRTLPLTLALWPYCLLLPLPLMPTTFRFLSPIARGLQPITLHRFAPYSVMTIRLRRTRPEPMKPLCRVLTTPKIHGRIPSVQTSP